MISIAKKKLLHALQQKKRRDAEGLFVAEGRKTVGDLLRGGLIATFVCGTPERLAEVAHMLSRVETAEASVDEIAEVSSLQTRSELLAIFRQPKGSDDVRPEGLTLALDEVQDPGNMGTIIRAADWFGVRSIVCSKTCADAFGPKAVQATMGALARVRVSYVDLEQWLMQCRNQWGLPVFGTFLEGENIYTAQLPMDKGVVVMGNEGRGVSPAVAKLVSQKLLIPSFPPDAETSESLNVSTATAIVLSEFRRPRG